MSNSFLTDINIYCKSTIHNVQTYIRFIIFAKYTFNFSENNKKSIELNLMLSKIITRVFQIQAQFYQLYNHQSYLSYLTPV